MYVEPLSGQAQGSELSALNRPLAGQTISGRFFFFFFFPKFFFYSPISAKEKSVEREQLRLSKCAASGKCVI